MVAERQMEAHSLNPKSAWPAPHAVMHQARLNSDVTITVYAGRCLHLHSDGTLKTGVVATQYLFRPPMWNFANSDDPDVTLDGGDPATEQGIYGSINAPRGADAIGLNCLVGLQTFEVETTEFQPEASLSGATYRPGDALTATAADTNQTTGGRITLCTDGKCGAQPVVGVVSHGVQKNAAQRDILSLWTCFFPKLTA